MYIYIYIFAVIILILVSLKIYIKVRFKFWSCQPVFHLYNIRYWLFPPGIITSNFYNQKYMNYLNIKTNKYDHYSDSDFKQFSEFIKLNYLNRKNIHYNPEPTNILPYFNSNTYISTYHKDNMLVGLITGTPLYVCLNNNEMHTYYIDYLCVHKNFRNKAIAPELIQTHEFFQRKNEKNIKTCLFKKETNQHYIVPLTIYNTYCFNTNYWTINPHNLLPPFLSLLKITSTNINLLVDFLSVIKHRFKCYIITSFESLIHLIKTNNLYIYVILHNNEIISAYFYKNSCVNYKNEKCVECIATLNNSTNINYFINGFYCSLKLLQSMYKNLIIENTSDSYPIIKHILNNHTPYNVNPTAYYFYNFAIRPIKESNVCLIF